MPGDYRREYFDHERVNVSLEDSAFQEINHGAVPAWTVTRGLEKYGKNVVAYMCLSAKEIEADEAKRLGLVVADLESVPERFNFNSIDDLYAAV